ncbi:hypothetical protein GRJ2_001905000 [Grus japonensis]|uniref:Uncharacterized protein n=1 Tax=Grus japonensis TaxID=30415 RepID=A0ABC9XCB6_GRUJA
MIGEEFGPINHNLSEDLDMDFLNRAYVVMFGSATCLAEADAIFVLRNCCIALIGAAEHRWRKGTSPDQPVIRFNTTYRYIGSSLKNNVRGVVVMAVKQAYAEVEVHDLGT